ncbi:transglycosylase SLT domain-containing protein [bacterium]|nr:transglycosylase SLT domain-containing protein [bacterium]
MPHTKLQYLYFSLSLIISLFFLGFFAPYQKDLHFPKNLALNQVTPHTVVEEATQEPLILFPFTTDAIQIKASGEDPESPSGVDDYLAARQRFLERFGNDYDEAWEEAPSSITGNFQVPQALREMVGFWIQIFGVYGKNQFVFHNRDDVGIVYSSLDLSDVLPSEDGTMNADLKTLKNQYLNDELKRIQKMLISLKEKLSKKEALNDEESRIVSLFSRPGAPKLDESLGMDSIRIQGGFSHRFRQAITSSGQYMKEMENIFAMKGIPVEITRLPFVESAFDVDAVSSAQAAGLWQFIPESGERYLKMDEYIDERLDPILATYAAASHLKNDYDLLGAWPLAINAYNTGPGRIMDAMKTLKTTDIGVINRFYNGPGYKFYSRNYYPEFLAALHVYENRDRYFGKIRILPSIKYDLFLTQTPVNLYELSSSLAVDNEVMQKLNPALAPEVLAGEVNLPGGYLVKVPHDLGKLFASRADEMDKTKNQGRFYLAQKGETLEKIAKDLKMSLTVLESMNPYLPGEKLAQGALVELPQAADMAREGVDETVLQ